MSVRTCLTSWLVLIALAVDAWGQIPSQPQNPPRLILPFRQQRQAGRAGIRQQVVPPTQQGQPVPRRIQPEDVRRLIEGFLPQNAPDSQNRNAPQYQNRTAPRYQAGRAAPPAARQTAPPVPRRAVVTVDQFRALTAPQQRELLVSAFVSLEEELNGMPVGEGWLKYLQLEALAPLLAGPELELPDDAARLRLAAIAKQFDSVRANPAYRAISDLWGFQTLQVGLPELAAEPMERAARLAVAGVEQLRQSLGAIEQGGGWVTYFELDELNRLARSAGALSPAARDRLRELIERLEDARQNAAYAMIANMRGFGATQRALDLLAKRVEQANDTASLADNRDMERIVQTIRQHLDAIQAASREECQARSALATAGRGTPLAQQAEQRLALATLQLEENTSKAHQGLNLLAAASKTLHDSRRGMRAPAPAGNQDALQVIQKMQFYDPSASAMGVKVLKKQGPTDALATKTLTPTDRQRAADMVKRLATYRQSGCATRVKLLLPRDDRAARAGETVKLAEPDPNATEELADRERITEIVERLYGESDRAEEIILMQFRDVPEPGEVTLMQFRDVADPPEYTLIQFRDVAEPAEYTLMQFSEVSDSE